MVKPLNAKLSQFIRAIPAVHIDSSGVQAIASSDFEAVQQKFEVMLASMHSENAALRAELGRAQEALSQQPRQGGWEGFLSIMQSVFVPLALGTLGSCKSCVIA